MPRRQPRSPVERRVAASPAVTPSSVRSTAGTSVRRCRTGGSARLACESLRRGAGSFPASRAVRGAASRRSRVHGDQREALVTTTRRRRASVAATVGSPARRWDSSSGPPAARSAVAPFVCDRRRRDRDLATALVVASDADAGAEDVRVRRRRRPAHAGVRRGRSRRRPRPQRRVTATIGGDRRDRDDGLEAGGVERSDIGRRARSSRRSRRSADAGTVTVSMV